MRKPLPARLDGLARKSGLYHMTMIDRPAPRNLRWIPLLILAAMSVGYALMIGAMHLVHPALIVAWAGSLLFFAGFTASNFTRLLGPRIVPDYGKSLDEREQALKARASSISGSILTVMAILCCFYIAFAGPFGIWSPTGTLDWVYLGLMIEGWAFILPVLVASWLQPMDAGD